MGDDVVHFVVRRNWAEPEHANRAPPPRPSHQAGRFQLHDWHEGSSPLAAAVQAKDANLLTSLLTREVRAFDSADFRLERAAALIAAARCGDPVCAHVLLRFDAGLANRTVNEQTPLLAAVFGNSCEVVRALVAAGSGIDSRGGWSKDTPLCAAIRTGRFALVQLLLSLGADVNRGGANLCAPLEVAAYHGDVATVKLLLESGAATAAPEGDERSDETALHAAVESGKRGVLQLLLPLLPWARDSPSRRAGRQGATPLWLAAHGANMFALQALLDAGASATAAAAHHVAGTTPLHIAAMGDSAQCVRLLLQQPGVEVDAARSDLATPLLLAVDRGTIDIVRVLLLSGADVERCCEQDRSMLRVSLLGGFQRAPNERPSDRRVSVLALLLAAGADVVGDSLLLDPIFGFRPSFESVRRLLTAAGAQGLLTTAASGAMDVDLAADIERYRRQILSERKSLVRTRVVEICLGLQSLSVPALQLLAIVDESLPAATLLSMHDKWQMIVEVKHWKRAS